jgi:predicted HAD superfamily phosphohydrolase YqeG
VFNKHSQRVSNYKIALNTVEGQEVLKDLAKMTGAYSSCHVVGDSLQTAFNEGKREVYNYIVRLLEANDELLHRQYHQDVGREQLSSFLEQQESDIYG